MFVLWRCREPPLGGVADASSECTHLGFPSLLRKNPENFAPKVIPTLGSRHEVSVAPALGACIGCALSEEGRVHGVCRLELAQGSTRWRHPWLAHPPAAGRWSPEPLPLGKMTCYWQRAFLCRRDHFVSGWMGLDFKFWIYFFLFPGGSSSSTLHEILLVNY